MAKKSKPVRQPTNTREHAAWVRRACECHEEMVSLLKELDHSFEHFILDPVILDPSIYERVRVLLRKAEGREG